MLKDLRNKNSIINTQEFKDFLNNEYNKEHFKKYDTETNIRDLYPLDIHITNKNKDVVNKFYIINKMILENNKRINRRVVKKFIVYKKDKTKSILSIQCKKDYLNVFMLPFVLQYDIYKKFKMIPKTNEHPLEVLYIIKTQEELDYFKSIIDKYLNEIFKRKDTF